MKQVKICEHYKTLFEEQNNVPMASRFITYSLGTTKNLDLLRHCLINNEDLPNFKFEQVNFNCVPTNIDVKEKELQLVVRASKLPISENAMVYVVAEFQFPRPSEVTISESIFRWFHQVKIEPKNLYCCSSEASRQLDIIYSTDLVPFYEPDSVYMEFDRPLSFYVDRGKSRTLKRKFKPVKLTFYEKTSFLTCDKKLGTVQLKIDDINDEISIKTKSPIMDGRRQTDASADIRINVREPLLNKSVRAHKENLLLLS